ncbi:MAG TPA: cupin domain-containing protein [Candidatus Acidoferrum sp.]|nr:cupin domain-containing protein [Candidatus Acidoferrum sp.]
MTEQVYTLAKGEDRAVERVLLDGNIHYLHIILPQNDALPEHFSNSNVYMTVLRGTLSIGLGEEETREYAAGTLLKIPVGTKMNIKNHREKALELILVKAPAPKA